MTCRISPDGATSCEPTGTGQLQQACASVGACDREMQCLRMGAGDDAECWHYCRLDGSTSCPIGPLGVPTRCLRLDELLFPEESLVDVDGATIPLPDGVGFCF